MRRKKKEDIKNIIQTMLHAHNHVLVLLQKGCDAEAVTLLSQCQECAEQIGKAIEKSEGMNTQVVPCLESYCELLYKMSKINDKKKVISLKQQIDNSLHNIKHEIEDGIKEDKTKIVFMPYKASMWDCMESIWEAAYADEECEVYVVPIPYYERNEKGEIEKICYDGELFPRYVPITYHEDFSLELEYPDIIYIHNPYDGANYVTSVKPEYYSTALKEYTDNLVYIPYYILGKGPMPESHLNLPAYQYADKIIVQDKEKAESLYDYVNQEKIVIMGSPKVDRIKKLNRKKKEIIEQEISEEWRKKIYGKKVILFNVSISGILQNSRYAIAKIKAVLSEFENREEIVLLWRPHPLVEATLRSMRPDIYEEYMCIKKAFVDKGKGILDESGDAGVAAVLADAYLGESSSSLVHYFGVLGKPILFINWKLTERHQERRDFFYFYIFFKENNLLYFVPPKMGLENSLYRLNIENGIIEKSMELPGVSDRREDSYCGAKKVGNRIILIPQYAEDIYIYDIDLKQAYKIVLPNFQEDLLQFSEAVEYKGKLYLIPKCYPSIVSIDVQSLRIYEFKECIAPFIQKEKYRPLFTWAFFKKKEYLYLASCNDSRILVFNMEDGTYIIKNIGEYSYGYHHMIYDGSYFWLAASESNHIIRWEEKSGETKEFDIPIKKKVSMDRVGYILLNKEEELVACDRFLPEMTFIDKKTGKCRKTERIFRKEKFELDYGFLFAQFIDEERAVLFDWGDKTVNIWNTHSNKRQSFQCCIPKSEMLKIEKKTIEKLWVSRSTPYSLSENMVTITQFIDYIACGEIDVFNRSYECYQQTSDSLTIGAKIHEYIKNI